MRYLVTLRPRKLLQSTFRFTGSSSTIKTEKQALKDDRTKMEARMVTLNEIVQADRQQNKYSMEHSTEGENTLILPELKLLIILVAAAHPEAPSVAPGKSSSTA